jgi:hypothetical protein
VLGFKVHCLQTFEKVDFILEVWVGLDLFCLLGRAISAAYVDEFVGKILVGLAQLLYGK